MIVEIKPHSQLVIKVDGSRRLTLRNRRFVRKLITGGNDHDDKSHKKNQELPLPPPSPVPTPSQSPRQDPVPPPLTPEHSEPSAHTGVADIIELEADPDQSVSMEAAGDTEVQLDEGVQDGGVEGVRDCGDGGDVRVQLPVEAGGPAPQTEPIVVTSPTRPRRVRKPNVKYSATEYDLSLVRQRSRRQIRRAK